MQIWYACCLQDERKSSNVRRKLEKCQLDPFRLGVLRRSAMEMYPLATGEKEDAVWQQCIRVIDEACRRLNRYQASV